MKQIDKSKLGSSEISIERKLKAAVRLGARAYKGSLAKDESVGAICARLSDYYSSIAKEIAATSKVVELDSYRTATFEEFIILNARSGLISKISSGFRRIVGCDLSGLIGSPLSFVASAGLYRFLKHQIEACAVLADSELIRIKKIKYLTMEIEVLFGKGCIGLYFHSQTAVHPVVSAEQKITHQAVV